MKLFCATDCATLHKLHKPAQNRHQNPTNMVQNVHFLLSVHQKEKAKQPQKGQKKRPFMTFKGRL